MRQLRGLGAVVVVVGLLALPRAASAQTPPYDSAIDVQLFDYSIGPKSFFTVDSADVADKKQVAMDAVVTFMTNPFTVYNTDGQKDPTITGERTRVVESVTAAQLTAAYGITDKLQVGANLPLIFSLAGKGLNPMTGTGCSDPAAMMSCTQVTGLGDLLVEGKMRLWQQQQFRLAGIFGISLPTSVGSDGSKFIGDDLPTGRARFAATYTTGNFSVGADLGVILRKPRTVYASTVGQQLTFGIGAAVAATDKLSVIGEFYGRGGIDSGFALDDSPMEAVGGVRLQAKSAFAVTLGGGAGLDRAIGAPTSRFFLSVGYSPDIRDNDGDGVPNGNDKCPLIAEDRDGFQDDDGCPDDDNDGDGIPDKEDKCPLQAEDHDGFEDDDGCPDLDNDKDGIADLQDRCPNDAEDGKEPYPKDGCPANLRDSDGDGIPDSADACPTQEEDMDGFEDGDGCPELDNDNDGVPDAADKCPLCPEDKDGFQDDDGCPELDNDKDGIPDAQDRCPMEPETVNGIKDDDGCPDQGAETVKLDGDRLEVTKAPTLAGGKLSAAGQVIVDDMALVMLGHGEVTKWLVAVGATSQKDAQKLADAIKARLAAKGIANVTAVGAQGPARVGGVVQERADADAAPVCPAGSEVKPRPEAVQPKALMPGVKPAAPAPAAPAPAAPAADAKPAPSAPPATP